MSTEPSKNITAVTIEEEMRRSYLDYAMSVIVSRALPDVRDGLKPVHRRILFAMKEAGFDAHRPYRKSARVTGEVMGKFHPHGNQPIYDAMVRMAQEFSMRLQLIDGHGNFGSMDGDPPAAERYTEARLARSAHSLLEDIDKETVDFQPNYDETTEEPIVLPARFPNLLVNGAGGIAVGMATNIPPHNLGEVIDACCAYIDNPDISVEALMEIVPGPDFPTGALILGQAGIREAYRTGRGSIIMRSRTHIETVRKDREAIIVTEVPYQVNKARMIERMAELVNDKTIEGIADLRDESDRDGVRMVIELKRDASADVVLNLLYRHTPLQTSFGANMLALNNGRPEMMPLREMIAAFVKFREEVITRRTRFELRKAREKAHILVGLAVAVANIDEIIALIRAAPDPQVARERLIEKAWPAKDIQPLIDLVSDASAEDISNGTYKLSDVQARAILDLRLHRLTGLERTKIASDLQEIAKMIQEYLEILGSRSRLLEILRAELLEMKEQFATPRRSEIIEAEATTDIEDLIEREDLVVTVSHGGYIKRVPLSAYRAQRRGGRGRAGMSTREEDFVSMVFVTDTHTPVLFFSTAGRAYELKGYRLPEGTPQSRGKAIVNVLPLEAGERIATIMPLPQDKELWDKLFIMFTTSEGNVRRNALSDFINIKSNGKIAIKLENNERLIAVQTCTEHDDILLATRLGKAIRFASTDVRQFSGRTSNGVRGIKLAKGDSVISMSIIGGGDFSVEERNAYLRQAARLNRSTDEAPNDVEGSELGLYTTLSEERFKELAAREQFLLTVSNKGFGKRTSAYEYRSMGRGGQGFANMELTGKNGTVVASFPVDDTDHIMLVTDKGQLIRCPVKDIRIAGRRTQGVTLFRVVDNESVVSVARIAEDNEDAPEETADH